jgi:hypothetical protein
VSARGCLLHTSIFPLDFSGWVVFVNFFIRSCFLEAHAEFHVAEAEFIAVSEQNWLVFRDSDAEGEKCKRMGGRGGGGRV